jgi:hypothetical protein
LIALDDVALFSNGREKCWKNEDDIFWIYIIRNDAYESVMSWASYHAGCK